MVKRFIDKIVGLYNYHGKFYMFVQGLEGAVVAALVSYDGNFPTSKAALISAVAFFGKAIWAFTKAYVIANANPTNPVQSPANPKQG